MRKSFDLNLPTPRGRVPLSSVCHLVFFPYNIQMVYLISLSGAENVTLSPNTRKLQELGISAGFAETLRFNHPTGIMYLGCRRNERGLSVPGKRMKSHLAVEEAHRKFIFTEVSP